MNFAEYKCDQCNQVKYGERYYHIELVEDAYILCKSCAEELEEERFGL